MDEGVAGEELQSSRTRTSVRRSQIWAGREADSTAYGVRITVRYS